MLEPVKLRNEEEWIKWSKEAINQREGDLNDLTDEELTKWYRDYRSEYNKKFGTLDGKLRKEHKQHKSKYDDLFKDKSKEEISDMINKMDISRTQKKRLRDKHGL